MPRLGHALVVPALGGTAPVVVVPQCVRDGPSRWAAAAASPSAPPPKHNQGCQQGHQCHPGLGVCQVQCRSAIASAGRPLFRHSGRRPPARAKRCQSSAPPPATVAIVWTSQLPRSSCLAQGFLAIGLPQATPRRHRCHGQRNTSLGRYLAGTPAGVWLDGGSIDFGASQSGVPPVCH